MVFTNRARDDAVQYYTDPLGDRLDLESPRLFFPLVAGTAPVDPADVDDPARLREIGSDLEDLLEPLSLHTAPAHDQNMRGPRMGESFLGHCDQPSGIADAQGVERGAFPRGSGAAECAIPQHAAADDEDCADHGDQTHLGEQDQRAGDTEELGPGVQRRLEGRLVPVEVALTEGNDCQVDQGEHD